MTKFKEDLEGQHPHVSLMALCLQLLSNFSASILSLPKVNLTKPRKLLNLELSNETQRCDHLNESSWQVLSNGCVHIVAEQSSCFGKFYV